MSAHTRVFNESSHRYLKRSQARNRVEQCLSAWVREGYTIRDLDVRERIVARAHRSRLESGLPAKEIEGVREVLPRSEVWTARVRYDVLGAAREFYLHETAH